MPVVRAAGSAPTQRFAWWSIGLWVLLLFAALGCVQYLRSGNYPYLAGGLVVIVVCAGCILRHGWARQAMRLVAVALAVWALVTGVLMFQQWDDFAQARQHAQAQPELGEAMLWLIARAERTWQVALALKGLSIPFLLWLAWILGRPDTARQFKRRR